MDILQNSPLYKEESGGTSEGTVAAPQAAPQAEMWLPEQQLH